MLIRWLALAFRSIRTRSTTLPLVEYVTWNRALFLDDDLAAKYYTPVSEELH